MRLDRSPQTVELARSIEKFSKELRLGKESGCYNYKTDRLGLSVKWSQCKEGIELKVELNTGGEFFSFSPLLIDALLIDKKGRRWRQQAQGSTFVVPWAKEYTLKLELSSKIRKFIFPEERALVRSGMRFD